MFKVKQACFFLTRRCNLRCPYCKVPLFKKKELNTKEVKLALNIIKKLGTELVVLFGGEPFLRKDLEEIIKYCEKIDLYYALISNSTLPLKFLPKNYTASVDTEVLGKNDNELKSIKGLARLLEIKDKIPDPVANIIIYKQNLDRIVPLVKKMNSLGIWSIIGLVHSGKEDFWMYRNYCPGMEVKDKEKVKEVCQELLKLKHQGVKIHNVDEYFEMMPNNLDLKWKCKEPYYLTIDEDGTLMTCPDFKGSEKFTIFDLPEKWNQFYKQWQKDKDKCPGCFYNHEIQVHYGGKLKHY